MSRGGPLLSVRDLSVAFGRTQFTHVAHDVTFDIHAGQKLALVGESGSGKSVTAMSILRLHDPVQTRYPTGEVLFDGEDLIKVDDRRMRSIRGREIAMIFQEPMTALNPVHPIGKQLIEPVMLHEGLSRAQARERMIALLDRTGIYEPHKRFDHFPHELSGGQRQRVMIAMALACNPRLLIADEPTTALDVTIQVQIIELLEDLQREFGMAVLMITHDLNMVRRFADRICVMKSGTLVENADKETLFTSPQHDYTKRLLASHPERLVDDFEGGMALMSGEDIKCTFPIRQSFFTGTFRLLRSGSADLVRGFRVYVKCLRRLRMRRAFSSLDWVARRALPARWRTHMRRQIDEIRAVDHVTIEIARGETLGIVGESGSGKTTLGMCLLRLQECKGDIHFEGDDLQMLAGRALRTRRQDFQIVFQDPFSSLSPRMNVAQIIGEGLAIHFPHEDRAVHDARILKIISEVGLGPEMLGRYPHEFSGGQRQRIAIARAVVLEPKLILLDEPTSALDVSVQKQVLALLADLQTRHGLSYLFITHDLAVIRAMSHRMVVMREGRIVEAGKTEQLFAAPKEAYTRTLLNASLFTEGGA